MNKVINADRILRYMHECGAQIVWDTIFAHCRIESADGNTIGTVNCRTYFRFLREKTIRKSGSDYSKEYYTLTENHRGLYGTFAIRPLRLSCSGRQHTHCARFCNSCGKVDFSINTITPRNSLVLTIVFQMVVV